MKNPFENPTRNPLESYLKNPSAPKESREETDRRAKEKSLGKIQTSLEKAIKDENDVLAKRLLEARKRVNRHEF